METTRNLARVFAVALRGAAGDLRSTTIAADAQDDEARESALATIDTIAEELDAFARRAPAPDPAGGAS